MNVARARAACRLLVRSSSSSRPNKSWPYRHIYYAAAGIKRRRRRPTSRTQLKTLLPEFKRLFWFFCFVVVYLLFSF